MYITAGAAPAFGKTALSSAFPLFVKGIFSYNHIIDLYITR